MLIAVFEDDLASSLQPLTLTRPSFMIRCGAQLLYEKIMSELEGKFVFYARGEVVEAARERLSGSGEVVSMDDLRALASGEDLLLVNGRWLFDKSLLRVGDECMALKDGELVYAYLRGDDAEKIAERCRSLPEFLDALRAELGEFRVDEARILRYPWDLIEYNREEILNDLKRLKRFKAWREPASIPGAYLVGENDFLISSTAKIYPCTVLDSSDGPVIIDDEAVVMPHSYLRGPCYVGRETWIVGGKVSASSIGHVCRVGGEVEETIIQGFSNKYHAGFLGHSYVGEWVNLGALTTVSDLKNDYSSVKVPIGGKLVDSGRVKVGAFIGDHVKTSIGSLLSTGSVIGVMCNLVTSGEPYPKYVPSFTWYVKGQVRDWISVESMIEAAERMMARRGIRMSEAEKRLYRRLYEETREERREFAERVLRS